MTHAFIIDWRRTSTTAEREIRIPVTVLEAPSMKVIAARLYCRTPYGLRTMCEVWSPRLDRILTRRLPRRRRYEHSKRLEEARQRLGEANDVRLLVHTQPHLVSAIPTKAPDIFEIRVDGGSIEERAEFAFSLLGKEVGINDFVSEGRLVDVSAVTKGKGFQGHIKRWGVKKLSHKNSKHRRMISCLGPKRPGYVRPTVPQAGQVGFHTRTELNKRVVKIGESGEDINPEGGFPHYGEVRNPYVLLWGSVPGPCNRLIRLREAVRPGEQRDKISVVYVSTSSKQGV